METDPLLPWLLANKLGLYASSLLAGGLGLHAALGVLERDGRQPAMRAAAWASAAALFFATARLIIVNAQLGGGIGAAFDASMMQWTWRSLGPPTVALLAGVVGVTIGWAVRNPLFAAAGAVALAASFALTGHSAALENPGLAPLAVGLHVLIAMFWIAAPFALWPRRELQDAALVVRLKRFSTIATWIIPVLFMLGIWLAWLLAGGLTPLLSETYGQLLVAKLLAASIALTLGAINKLCLTRAIMQENPTGRRLLKITLTVELGVFVVALLLVGAATTAVGPHG